MGASASGELLQMKIKNCSASGYFLGLNYYVLKQFSVSFITFPYLKNDWEFSFIENQTEGNLRRYTDKPLESKYYFNNFMVGLQWSLPWLKID